MRRHKMRPQEALNVAKQTKHVTTLARFTALRCLTLLNAEDLLPAEVCCRLGTRSACKVSGVLAQHMVDAATRLFAHFDIVSSTLLLQSCQRPSSTIAVSTRCQVSGSVRCPAYDWQQVYELIEDALAICHDHGCAMQAAELLTGLPGSLEVLELTLRGPLEVKPSFRIATSLGCRSLLMLCRLLALVTADFTSPRLPLRSCSCAAVRCPQQYTSTA